MSPIQPITFCRDTTLTQSPEAICARLLELERWPEFRGYGPLPGVAVARFEKRTPEVLGSVIEVRNTDGSRHREEIVHWEPSRRVVLRLSDFSAPLSRLASHFDETWQFALIGEATHVVRCFDLFPKSRWTRFPLWILSLLLRQALDRHLRQMTSADRAPRPRLPSDGETESLSPDR